MALHSQRLLMVVQADTILSKIIWLPISTNMVFMQAVVILQELKRILLVGQPVHR